MIEIKRLHIIIIVGLIIQFQSAYSEIIFDGTIKPEMEGKKLEGNFEIKSGDGLIIGKNLFHSFTQFNIYNNESATFSGPDNIQNVISRVTGGEISVIDGTLNSTIPNFYFLNPAGVFFGKDASLNLKGSFHVSTADYLIMKNGDKYYSNYNDYSNSLLSSSDPSAFGFIKEPIGNICITDNKKGIEVIPGNTMSFIGGNVEIKQSDVIAPEGQINIIGVKSACEIGFTDFELEDVIGIKRATITITDESMIDVNGSGSGDIVIIGGDFYLNNQSIIMARTEGEKNGGKTYIDVENLDVSFSSLILSEIISGENNKGGDVLIRASESVILSNFSKIKTSTTGNHSGDIEIYSKQVSLIRGSKIDTRTTSFGNGGKISIISTANVYISDDSILSSDAESTGNAGMILIDAENIIFEEGSGLASQTKKNGIGGTIKLYADKSIKLIGTDDSGYASTITSDSSGKGKAGDVSITAKFISLIDGGGIFSDAKDEGDGGNITINASNGKVEMIGVNPHGENEEGFNSGIYSRSKQNGKAGNITINTESLFIENGALINNSTSENGESGLINIHSETIVIKGIAPSISSDQFLDGQKFFCTQNLQSKTEKFSGIYSRSSSHEYTNKPGGKINIEAASLSLFNKGVINSSSSGKRDAGEITLNVKQLILDKESVVSSESLAIEDGGAAGMISINAKDSIIIKNNSSITTETVDTAFTNITNDNGKISINAQKKLYIINSEITTSVKDGSGKGGDIISDSEFLIMNHSKIIANAYAGKGGDIHIITDHLVKSADSDVNADSVFGLDGSVVIESPDGNVNNALTVLPDNFLNATKWMKTPCKSRSGDKVSHLVHEVHFAMATSFEDWIASPPLPFKTIQNYSILNEAEQLYNKANLNKTVVKLEQALPLLDKSSNIYFLTLASLVYNYQALGFHNKAITVLDKTKDILTSCDDYSNTIFYNCLADLNLSLGRINKANKNIKKASEFANKIQDPVIFAVILNNNGNILAVNEDLYEVKDYQDAILSYRKSLEYLAQTNQLDFLKSKVLINLSRVEFLNDNINKSFENLKKALKLLKAFPDCYNKAFDLLALGSLSMKISKQIDYNDKYLSYEALKLAEQTSKSINSNYLISSTFGQMSRLFAYEKKISEAMKLNEKAMFFAQIDSLQAILYEWQWERARLFKTEGNVQASIKLYKKTIATLNPIRLEFFRGYRNKKLSFNYKVRPVYMELIELLLCEEKKNNSKEMLKNIRDLLEDLKKMELEDYFQDECLDDFETKGLDKTHKKTALLYTISLHDHLVLMLTLPDGIQEHSVPISFDEISENVKLFHKEIGQQELSWNRILYYPQVLYDSLVKPIESALNEQNIETLIVATDGILRSIPFCVLHDGENFLVEKYAIVTVPAATLIDPDPLTKCEVNILLNGLSKARLNFPALDYVNDELYGITKFFKPEKSKVLIDENYTVTNLKKEFSKKIYSIIHMATHAQFSGNLEDTYLMTYKKKIGMKQLAELINMGRYQNKKINLIILSACQTAIGDERASLGLAGVALKAGVKNAVATLWRVDDKATSKLMKEFYKQLNKPLISKAKALQYAQRAFIRENKNTRYKNPFYWAPFLLIGSWR